MKQRFRAQRHRRNEPSLSISDSHHGGLTDSGTCSGILYGTTDLRKQVNGLTVRPTWTLSIQVESINHANRVGHNPGPQGNRPLQEVV